MIPIRLLVSVVIIGVVLLLSVWGYRSLQPTFATNQLQRECDAAVGALTSLVEGGAARDVDDPLAPLGTRRVLSFDVPGDCVYLAFGGDPDPQNNGALRPLLLGSGAVIVYRVEGASKQVIWCPGVSWGFRAGGFDGCSPLPVCGEFFVRGGGRITLVFELVHQENEQVRVGISVLVNKRRLL